MAPTLFLVVTVWIAMATMIHCVPANTQNIPSNSMIPGVLSGDQSLPPSMILPPDAMPTDLLVGVNGVGSQAMPVAMNGGNSMAGSSQLQPDMSKAGQYPAAPKSLSSTGMATSEGSFGQGFQNAVDRGLNGYPTGNNPPMAGPPMNMYPGPTGSNPPMAGPPMNMYPGPTGNNPPMADSPMNMYPGPTGNNPPMAGPPMNMYPGPTGNNPTMVGPPMNMYPGPTGNNAGQMMPSLPANMVLMNIQMACQSIQRFVMSTPMAKEIMTSVTNMNNMADMFKTNTQCGMSALSASLRMFLKTCNLFTSCPNPAHFPFPVFDSPLSPAVPYTVQLPKPKSTGEPVKPQVQKALKNLPAANRYPEMRPPYQARVTPMVKMFQNLMYGFRPQNINSPAGQTTQATATQEASGASDD